MRWKTRTFFQFATLVVSAMLCDCNPRTSTASEGTVADADSPKDTELEHRGSSIAAVRALLSDPDSARFDSVVAYGKAGGYYYCGIVNSKNGFGGYDGGQMFIVMPDIGAQINDNTLSFRKTWKTVCGSVSDGKVVDFNLPT